MTAAALWTAAVLAVVGGYGRAVVRCRTTVRTGKTAAHRRAAAARELDVASQAWDADTARLASALAALPDGPAPAGFGDALVAQERLRLALATLNPTPTVEDFPL